MIISIPMSFLASIEKIRDKKDNRYYAHLLQITNYTAYWSDAITALTQYIETDSSESVILCLNLLFESSEYLVAKSKKFTELILDEKVLEQLKKDVQYPNITQIFAKDTSEEILNFNVTDLKNLLTAIEKSGGKIVSISKKGKMPFFQAYKNRDRDMIRLSAMQVQAFNQ